MLAISEYWKAAFPEVSSEWTSVNEDQPGKVVVTYEAHATHNGIPFCGMATSNREVDYTGTTTYYIQNGKLVDYKADVDVEGIKQTLSTF